MRLSCWRKLLHIACEWVRTALAAVMIAASARPPPQTASGEIGDVALLFAARVNAPNAVSLMTPRYRPFRQAALESGQEAGQAHGRDGDADCGSAARGGGPHGTGGHGPADGVCRRKPAKCSFTPRSCLAALGSCLSLCFVVSLALLNALTCNETWAPAGP